MNERRTDRCHIRDLQIKSLFRFSCVWVTKCGWHDLDFGGKAFGPRGKRQARYAHGIIFTNDKEYISMEKDVTVKKDKCCQYRNWYLVFTALCVAMLHRWMVSYRGAVRQHRNPSQTEPLSGISFWHDLFDCHPQKENNNLMKVSDLNATWKKKNRR